MGERTEEKLVNWLFETRALRVSKQDQPFWYTSGTIGPYFINTHFLYGSGEKANDLLKVIDREKENKFTCPLTLLEMTWDNYKKDAIYKGLIDKMCGFIKNNISLEDIHYISGGERRDWFFSLIVAEILGLPHITIYKDLTTVVSQNGVVEPIEQLKGKNVLHIADLITEASSYGRAWIPAIKNIGGELKWSLVVVDRKQGGAEFLESQGVKSYSLVSVDDSLFKNALSMGYINLEQYNMVTEYTKNPKASMRKFLIENPDFLKQALQGDEKTKERARLCVEKNIYELGK